MAGKAASIPSSRSTASDSRRNFFVLAALAGSLTLTGLGLKVLSPPPVSAPERLFSTQPIAQATPVLNAQKAWKSIYVRQSKTAGDTSMIAGDEITDHFMITTAPNGECEVLISPRWKSQVAALPPRGAKSLPADCISICLVGDFDRGQPAYGQVQRLAELVNSLQAQHRIPGQGVFWMNVGDSPVGIGKRFPVEEFRKRVMR